MTDAVRVRDEEDGALLRVTASRPPGNVLDRAMFAAMRAAVAGARGRARCVLFEGDGANFSFGASIQEHRREHAAGLLAEFHGLLRDLAASRMILIASVRGACLGGGLELAAFCHRVVAAPDARLGCPEVSLGVFAPAASIVLPHRVGRPAAEELLLTGRTVSAREALAMRLVDAVANEPEAAAVYWYREYIQMKSAVALGFALQAVRARLHADLGEPLAALERLYLDELLTTHDAEEGIRAFLEKRLPEWKQR